MTDKKIAIVGFGAAGLTLLIHFLKKYQKNQHTLKVVIYEREAHFARGYVYQDDKDCMKINRHYSNMTLYDKNDTSFKTWAEQHCSILIKQYNGYLPRRIFGEYMLSEYAKLKSKFKSIIHEKKIMATNIGIGKTKNYFIEDESTTYEEFDAIILAIGHPEPKNIFKLTRNYINNPYPSSALKTIPNNSTVGIIGTGLTAIDVSLSLIQSGHQGKIILSSRNAYIHDKKEEYEEQYLEYFNDRFISKIEHKDNKIRLALKAFSLELKRIGVPNIKKLYLNDISTKVSTKILQNLLFSMNLSVEKLWLILDQEEKDIFFNKYFKFWIRKKASVSPENYKKFSNLLDNKKISITSGLANITQEKKCYTMHANRTIVADYIINATGSPRHLNDIENSIALQLIENKIGVHNKYGGITVDKNSNEVISITGEKNKNLYAIGHITCGVFLFSSYINHVIDRAKIVADNLNKNL